MQLFATRWNRTLENSAGNALGALLPLGLPSDHRQRGHGHDSHLLQAHGILEQHEYALSGSDDPNLSTTDLFRRGLLRPTALEIFYRCLDRNLKAGVREKTICYAFTGHEPHRPKLPTETQRHSGAPADVAHDGSRSPAIRGGSRQHAHPSQSSNLFSGQDASKWYASRKLDGVSLHHRRTLQPETSPSGSQTWKVMSISSLSRTVGPFRRWQCWSARSRRC